jgi:hemoglobin
MSGRYHGRPVPAHKPQLIHGAHFGTRSAPPGAAHVIERAQCIARSLHNAVKEEQAASDANSALG